MSTAPLFEKSEVVRTLRLLHPGSVFEVRLLGERTHFGYFDDPAQTAAALEGAIRRNLFEGCYVTLNPTNPALLARCANDIRQAGKKDAATKDEDIIGRSHLLVDCDPVRPRGISSSDGEKNAAHSVALRIREELEGLGFPPPILADSGNGWHLLFRVDLPAADAGLVESFLKALAARFSTPTAAVDVTVANAARISKIYGTAARKGSSTADRPHRMARLVDVPDPWPIVPEDLIRKVAALWLPVPTPTKRTPASAAFSVDRFISTHIPQAGDSEPWEGGRRWIVNPCVFNADHTGTSAALFELSSGVLAYKCQHNGCAGRTWADVRAMFEPRIERGPLHEVPRTRGNLALAPVPDVELIPETWAPRRPLRPASTVPTLPAELVPSPLRSWLVDVASRVSVPLEFVAAPAIVGLGAVVGRGLTIRPGAKDDFFTPANLWGGIVGPPGCMKTGAVDQALRPVERLAAKARAAFEAASADRDADLEEIEAKRKAARSELEKSAKAKNVDEAAMRIARDKLKAISAEETEADVRERRYMTSDATIEKLGQLLNENPRGLLVKRDELTGWLRGLDREDRAQDRAFYLESWNGTGSFTVDRIGRGTLHVPALTLSIVGGIQPGRLSTYTRGALAGEDDADGLLQRFQVIVWPDEFGEWRAIDRWPDREARDRAFRIFETLSELDPISFGATVEEGELPFLRFAPDAQALFFEWRTELERRVRFDLRETPAFESHVAKFRSLLPKLALLFHLVDVADGGRVGPVTLKAAQLGAAWVEFLEAHARKVYAEELDSGASAAHALGGRIERGDVVDGVSIRDLARREWPGLARSGTVYEAASTLEALGWLRVATIDTGGRPSDVIRLHPDLRRRPA